MTRAAASIAKTLSGASVIVCRPRESAGAQARAARARGATALRLPATLLAAPVDVDATRAALQAALGADAWIFTSPAAVAHCRQVLGDEAMRGVRRVWAVGRGSGRALKRIGIVCSVPSGVQNSEGLLAEAKLKDVQGWRIAIIDAPGGRDLLAPALVERGATVQRIGVYRRIAGTFDARRLAQLAALPDPWLTLLSSADALANLRAALPEALQARWRAGLLIVSSERLAELARAERFARIHVAASALNRDLMAAAERAFASVRRGA